MSTAGPRLNAFESVRSCKKELPSDDRLAQTIRAYDYVLQHRLGGVEVLDAKAYDELPDDLLELRAFDAHGELHLVCLEGERLGRIRTDGPDDGDVCVTVFDEEHQVWGSDVSMNADGLVLTEDRGTVVRLPASVAIQLPDILKVTKGNKTKDDQQRYVVTVRVRNYLDEDGSDPESGDTSFAFVDYRLMGFNVREVR